MTRDDLCPLKNIHITPIISNPKNWTVEDPLMTYFRRLPSDNLGGAFC